jgi:predicted ATPase/class 3 adenylate cyclase
VAETTCTRCGTLNRAGRKFCAECGAALGVSCPTCGAANEPGERYCGECGTALEVASGSLAQPSVAVERRLVSVLFADLVGFTRMSEAQDAEEVRELLSRYFELSARVLGRYGGVVEKFIGDAVMAVWGTPVAQEDDAERAVRAGLDLAAAVAEFGSESGMTELAARVGVLTGEAAVNLGAVGQGMVAGDLVNTASRAQAMADPGAVLVGEATRRATDSAIAYADAGSHDLKGKAEPVQLWRALRVTAGRAGGLKSEGIEPPFVGRERELRLAKELFHASADERKAHLLSITGIAGIGKSRLAWELYKHVDGIAQEVAWHRGRCLAYGEGVTFWALAEMVRMRAGVAEGEDEQTARSKLDATLDHFVEDADERAWIRPRLLQLLSLEARESLEQADLFGGWRLFFERVADRDPVVLVFEDMQWADAPLLEFIEYLLDWSRDQGILVLALARPELADRHPQWSGGLRNTTTLALEPLSTDAMEALLDGFAPGLPVELRARILDRAEGVPLYAVETVRMLLDRGLLEQAGDEYRPTAAIEELEVPETLQALIAARLDGLPADERDLLQGAAVLGKAFARPSLAAVAGLDESELDRLLAGLVRKQVLAVQADPRSPERGQYSFLQDLLRQVAYETLSRRERKARHLATADYLERQAPEGDTEVVEIVASHVLSALELDPEADDAGELRARAEAMLVRAGSHAATLGAPESAQRYFEQALELSENPLERAELHERAGRMAYLEGSAADARRHFESAIATFESLGSRRPAARVAARLGLVAWQLENDIESAVAGLEQSFEKLVEERDAALALAAATLARLLYFRGRGAEAMEPNELALEIAEALELPEVLSQGLTTKSLLLVSNGRHREADVLLRYALEVALAHDASEAALRAYNNLCSYAEADDRYQEALERGAEYAEYGRRVGDRTSAGRYLGWSIYMLYVLGEWDDACSRLEQIDLAEAPIDPRTGDYPGLAVSSIHALRGDVLEARVALDRGRDAVDPNAALEEAEWKVSEAVLLVAEGRPWDALASAEQALAIREEIGMRWAVTKEALEVALTAALAADDRSKVDELLEVVRGTPLGQRSPHLRAIEARFVARRAALDGETRDAEEGFTVAARTLREIERPFDLGVVLLEHAEWLSSEGRAEEAAPLAAEGREIFERLRAMPYLERLDRVLVGAPVGET